MRSNCRSTWVRFWRVYLGFRGLQVKTAAILLCQFRKNWATVVPNGWSLCWWPIRRHEFESGRVDKMINFCQILVILSSTINQVYLFIALRREVINWPKELSKLLNIDLSIKIKAPMIVSVIFYSWDRLQDSVMFDLLVDYSISPSPYMANLCRA